SSSGPSFSPLFLARPPSAALFLYTRLFRSSYTPALNDDSSVTFGYAVSDGIAAPVPTTATLDITPVNDAPVTTPVVLAPIAEDSDPRSITLDYSLSPTSYADFPTLTSANLA